MTEPVVRVLVVEDGEEYSRTFGRFLGAGFALTRAGSGPEALALDPGAFDVVFMDMRFDRVPPEALLGDAAAVADRFNGDRARTLRFLEDNQGTFIVAALREAGWRHPVVFSHDFSAEPRRWAHLARTWGPLEWLADNAGPDAVAACLRRPGGGPATRPGG